MAKQDIRQRAIRRGQEELRKGGFPAGDPLVSAIDFLVFHFGTGKEMDLAVIFLLGRIVDPTAVEALTGLEPKAIDREVKREIRRSLFKLAQKGLVAPKGKEGLEKTETSVFGLGPKIEGYFSSVDGGGNRLVWLVKPQFGSGIDMIQGIVNDRQGLIQLGGSALRRKDLRRMVADIKEKHGITLIPVPWDYVDWVLYEAFEKAKGSGREGLEQFLQIRAHMNLAKPSSRPHPVYDHLNTLDARSGAWRESSQKLLEEPEFRTWVLDEDWIQPYAIRIEEALESRLVLNPLQKEERMGRLISEIVRELFITEAGETFTRRMEDMALYLYLTDRKDPALIALAVSLAVKERDLGGLGVPFLYGLIQRSLALYSAQEKGQEQEKQKGSSLIIKR